MTMAIPLHELDLASVAGASDAGTIPASDAGTIWQHALGELQLQMTKATFDTWLRGSLATLDGDTLVIHCRSVYAVDWLAHRLSATISRVVDRLAGRHLGLTFAADKQPDRDACEPDIAGPDPDPAGAGEDDRLDLQTITLPDLVSFEAEFNERIRRRGFAMLTNYAIRFWSELLGPVPFLCWIAAFARDKRDKTKFTGLSQPVKFSIARLARIAANGRVQAVRGVWRKCPAVGAPGDKLTAAGADGVERYWQPGAFDVLRAERVGLIDVNRAGAWRPWDPALEQPGQALRRQRYRLRVYVPLPLLTPAQVARLEDVSQDEHESWLEETGIDKALWESLTVDTLGMTAITGGAS